MAVVTPRQWRQIRTELGFAARFLGWPCLAGFLIVFPIAYRLANRRLPTE